MLPSPDRCNIELKARRHDLAADRRIAAQLATTHLGLELQRDTYFQVPHGRLKLREIEGQPALLIWYERATTAAAKASAYQLVDVPNPAGMLTALGNACGIDVVVEKSREIFLVENVRIHLDHVAGLGDFLEFEAVLAPPLDHAAGHAQLARLSAAFAISTGDLVAESYRELLRAAQPQ